MKSDVKGRSTCPRGQERYERWTGWDKKPRVQYDYRAWDGALFSTIAGTLDDYRQRRDEWLAERAGEVQHVGIS